MKLRIAAWAVIGMVLYSCSPAKTAPAETPVPPKTLSPELAEGKNLYENNCARCHKLYDRREYTAEQWTPILMRMQKKAKIGDAEREKIYKYLTMN